MNKHAENLRRTRADMLGTDDEEHYWECHNAAAEIDYLETSLTRHAIAACALDEKIERLEAVVADYKENDRLIERIQAKVDALELRAKIYEEGYNESQATIRYHQAKVEQLEGLRDAVAEYERVDNTNARLRMRRALAALNVGG